MPTRRDQAGAFIELPSLEKWAGGRRGEPTRATGANPIPGSSRSESILATSTDFRSGVDASGSRSLDPVFKYGRRRSGVGARCSESKCHSETKNLRLPFRIDTALAAKH